MSDTNSKAVFFVGEDAYEIYYAQNGIEQVLMYREGRNVKGEVLDFDTLPFHVQKDILTQLSKHRKRCGIKNRT